MNDKLEQELKKIIELVKLCPANLQEKCFEILLSNILLSQNKPFTEKKSSKEEPIKEDASSEPSDVSTTGDQEEIKLSDLHVKAKKLMEQGVTLEQINNIFYKEGSELKPLFDDLKSSKIIESQTKLALLEALKNGIQYGNFEFDTNIVKQQCDIYKCYDSNNFASNFKRQKDLFNESYATGGTMSLSTTGKKELINVIKELSI